MREHERERNPSQASQAAPRPSSAQPSPEPERPRNPREDASQETGQDQHPSQAEGERDTA